MSLFYTIMPSEELFEGWEEYEPVLVEVQAGQAVLLVRVDGADGETLPERMASGIIERVISADPSLYLVPELAPGTTVHFSVGAGGKGMFLGTAGA